MHRAHVLSYVINAAPLLNMPSKDTEAHGYPSPSTDAPLTFDDGTLAIIVFQQSRDAFLCSLGRAVCVSLCVSRHANYIVVSLLPSFWVWGV